MTQHNEARAVLRDATAHLEQARARLAASPPAYAEALDAILASFRASFEAALTNYGASTDADDPLDELAERAVRSLSVLKTSANRALHFVGRAPAIRTASQLTVNDREEVETGVYTARNLIQAVSRQLAATA